MDGEEEVDRSRLKEGVRTAAGQKEPLGIVAVLG